MTLSLSFALSAFLDEQIASVHILAPHMVHLWKAAWEQNHLASAQMPMIKRCLFFLYSRYKGKYRFLKSFTL